MDQEKFYRVYVPIEIELRKKVRILAALRDMRPAEFLADVIKDYLGKNRLDNDQPMMKAS
jgi:hypothetical protein